MVVKELLSHITSCLLPAPRFADGRDTAQFVYAWLVIVDRIKPGPSLSGKNCQLNWGVLSAMGYSFRLLILTEHL